MVLPKAPRNWPDEARMDGDATMTKIEWTDDTLQLTTGCTKVSPGCANCYAERMHKRLAGMGRPMYQQPFGEVKCWPHQIDKIAKLPAGKKVFINSMSDLFHEDVPASFILSAFAAFAQRPDIIFQFLTKRADRMAPLVGAWIKDGVTFREGCSGRLPNNIWLGVTVCNQAEADAKIPLLLQVPAAVRFVSIEPMLGPMDIRPFIRGGKETYWQCKCGEKAMPLTDETVCKCGDVYDEEWSLNSLSWVICGGETGPGARPMHPDWVRSLRDQCAVADVPFFFKGWGEWVPRSQLMKVNIDAPWGTVHETGEFFKTATPWNGHDDDGSGEAIVYRFGKKAAGRVLDGRTWEEFPNG